MKKVLIAASTLSHIENFHTPYLKHFKDLGFEIHVIGKKNKDCTIPYADKVICIDFEKKMISLKNILNILKISKLIRSEKYFLIYTHTILASFFTRLGIVFSLTKIPIIINTVHGYLFDKNSSWVKKIIMLSAEKSVSFITDYILVMNNEDYNIAKKYNLYTKNLFLIKGMGFNSDLFNKVTNENKLKLRSEYNFSKNDFILIYVAEFSKRKNQKFLVNSLKKLSDCGFSNIKLLLIGDGALLEDVKKYSSELGVYENIVFAGYKKNTNDYYNLSDICVSASRIEGLPFNIMESMSCGLPVVASNIKGHSDLISPNLNGFLYNYNDTDAFCNYIETLLQDKILIQNMSKNNIIKSLEYSSKNVLKTNIELIDKLVDTKLTL
ncbi:glycosyltransferase [Clostridium sp.]|uniref:glycosyltransferase n=1 Tax=Clostridium sp. TaxID=1506 RepID=UPI002911BEBC|nr:glycosyltransferase [Clostridium sp.]MDU6542678.1 glycosyltransferase [Clostridium sp.]